MLTLTMTQSILAAARILLCQSLRLTPFRPFKLLAYSNKLRFQATIDPRFVA